MKEFLAEDFLLPNETAKRLYSDYAKDMPIADYHCHLSPREIAEDRRYGDIAQLWLTGGDHYKWRLLRASGCEERLVTGDASDYEKFEAWARCLPYCAGNPLYVWSHMELRKYFGYNGLLNGDTCREVWEACNSKLGEPGMSARGFIRSSGVKFICTTDEPADTLEWHDKIKAGAGFEAAVLPAFRPDAGMYIERPGFAEYIAKLGASEGAEIKSFADLTGVYEKRIAHFAARGCRTADHGFEAVPYRREGSGLSADASLKKALRGEPLTPDEIEVYKTELFLFLAAKYRENDWVMQLHCGPSRNNSSRLMSGFGPDAGGDAIGGYNNIMPLTRLFDELDRAGKLPKTIIYSLNPADDTALDALAGVWGGRVFHGAAWWFSDHTEGIRKQLKSLAANSVLGRFPGMLTDSRSFLSYVRHDYFRRVLCGVLGEFIERGEYPGEAPELGQIIRDICYNNTVKLFNLS